MRFPEAALHLAKPPRSASGTTSATATAAAAEVLLYPSAFTVPTGKAHWEPLLRARAIETQSWVVAAAQVGRHHGPDGKRVSFGRSLVVDPWGKVVVELKGVVDVSNNNNSKDGQKQQEDERWEAEDGAVGELGVFEVDLGEVERIRERMPLMRRT